jgi:hypothetical protein
MNDMVFFTICSRNFIGHANALHDSVMQFYPRAEFFLVLCDDSSNLDLSKLKYPVIRIEELGIPNLEFMLLNYNITEMNTALKPFSFLYLFDKYKERPIIYLDPDILLFGPLAEVEVAFEAGAHCVLTPHICEPAEYADMSDLQFLRYGMYNLGFCGLRGSDNVKRVTAWWARRLEQYCIIDLERGIFVDQKWCDYFPSFIPLTTVIHHPGYNVAYWNLAQRRLSYSEPRWLVNNLPLVFFHFSGHKVDGDLVFTRHSSQFTPVNTPELADLLLLYRNAVRLGGHDQYYRLKFAYSWSGSKGFNEHTPE